MSDNNNEFSKRKPANNGGGGMQGWVVAVIIMGIIGFILMSRTASLTNIKFNQFEKMILQGDVEKVSVVEGNRSVEVTLTKDALQKPEYKKDLGNNRYVSGGPHFKIEVVSVESFMNDYRES